MKINVNDIPNYISGLEDTITNFRERHTDKELNDYLKEAYEAGYKKGHKEGYELAVEHESSCGDNEYDDSVEWVEE